MDITGVWNSGKNTELEGKVHWVEKCNDSKSTSDGTRKNWLWGMKGFNNGTWRKYHLRWGVSHKKWMIEHIDGM